MCGGLALAPGLAAASQATTLTGFQIVGLSVDLAAGSFYVSLRSWRALAGVGAMVQRTRNHGAAMSSVSFVICG